MFSKKAFVLAFLSISLSASAAPAADCTLTQSVTARSAASAVFANTGNGKNAGGAGKAAAGAAAAGKGGNAGAAAAAKGGNAGGAAAAKGGNAGAAAAAKGGNAGNNNNNNGNATAAAAAGNNGNNNGNNNNNGGNNNNNGGDQSSLTLDPQLVQTGFEQDGQGADADPGQVASATSNNNFINYCGTTNLPLTNGTQIKTGSCNAAPMGMIAATTAMPSSKFVNPKNLDTVPANQNITIQMAISNLDTGNFVNPNTNYFSAPQQTSSSGVIQGHSHVVVEAIDSLTSTATTDPTKFAFFQGFNDAAQNGILSATIAGGLPEGVYKMSSINSAANHQPVLVAVAQHGSLDDAVYFTVSNNGGGNNNAGGNNNNAGGNNNNAGGNNNNAGGNGNAAASASAAAASSSAAAASNNGGKGNAGAGAAGAKGGAAAGAKGAAAAGAGAKGGAAGAKAGAAAGAAGAKAGAAGAKGKRWLWE